jgi:hypothetical protein
LKNIAKFAMGVGLSASASYVWTLIPNSNNFAYSPLAFIEHYHWGLASFVVGKNVKKYSSYLNGFGMGMIVVEAASPQPFGVGKPPEQVIGGIALGGVLVLALLF